MNVFRLAGDMSHLFAIIILLFKIYRSESCAGVSGKSQALFALVFSTRYMDLMTNFVSTYNSIMKVVFILSSYFTLYLIYFRYKSTYESKLDSFRFEFLALIAGMMALMYNHQFVAMEVLWTFSIYLEAIAIIPQLYMFYNTKDVSMFPSQYVFAMGSYRALYILNWIWRYYTQDYYDMIAIGAGVIQTFLYLDFFYIYFMNGYGVRKHEQLQTVVV